MNKIMKTGATVLLLSVTGAAQAHPLHGAEGLLSGLAHPFLGLDHILAMVAVGLWAVQRGRAGSLLIPGAFVLAILLGGIAGISGLAVPALELGIAGSVVVFGSLLLFAARLPLTLGLGLTGTFAAFHGYAHGAEITVGVSPWQYSLGFVSATIALHAIGMSAGVLLRRRKLPQLARAGGAAIAASGLALVVAAV